MARDGVWPDLQVVCMNVYDVALDFVLMDAFYDLEHPPSTIVAILQNRWISAGMKQSVCACVYVCACV